MSKLSIKEEMRAIDCRVKGWWESLTEEEVKKISPFVLMRWTSAVQSSNSDIEFHYIALVNELHPFSPIKSIPFLSTTKSSLDTYVMFDNGLPVLGLNFRPGPVSKLG